MTLALQIVINASVTAALVAVIGQSFGIVSRCSGTFHLALGAAVTLGAYLFLAVSRMGGGLLLGLFGAVLGCALTGILIEMIVLRPLRRQGSGPLPMLLASLALYQIAESLVAAIWEQKIQSYRSGVSVSLSVLGAVITARQVVILVVCVLLYGSVALWLRTTSIGRQVRAVGSNRGLATMIGLDPEWINLQVAAVGFSVIGVAGILIGWEVDIQPSMGFLWLLSGTVAMVIGGSSRADGVLWAAFAVALLQSLVALVAGSEWSNAATYVLLLLFLWWRPTSLLGPRVTRRLR